LIVIQVTATLIRELDEREKWDAVHRCLVEETERG